MISTCIAERRCGTGCVWWLVACRGVMMCVGELFEIWGGDFAGVTALSNGE